MSDRPPGARDRWTPALVAAVLLVVGSALPLPARYNPDTGPFGPDKGLHLLGHAGLVAGLAAALDDGDCRAGAALGAVGASTALGLAVEGLQESVPGRAFETDDVVAGAIGSLVGLLAWRRRTGRADRPDRR